MESFFVALVVFVFSLFVPVGSVGAQKSVENEIDVSKTYPNGSYKEIFRRFPLLDSIMLEFSNGSPSFMTWFSSDLSKGRDWQRGVEYFDLVSMTQQQIPIQLRVRQTRRVLTLGKLIVAQDLAVAIFKF